MRTNSHRRRNLDLCGWTFKQSFEQWNSWQAPQSPSATRGWHRAARAALSRALTRAAACTLLGLTQCQQLGAAAPQVRRIFSLSSTARLFCRVFSSSVAEQRTCNEKFIKLVTFVLFSNHLEIDVDFDWFVCALKWCCVLRVSWHQLCCASPSAGPVIKFAWWIHTGNCRLCFLDDSQEFQFHRYFLQQNISLIRN